MNTLHGSTFVTLGYFKSQLQSMLSSLKKSLFFFFFKLRQKQKINVFWCFQIFAVLQFEKLFVSALNNK